MQINCRFISQMIPLSESYFRDNGLELDARRQFIPPMRHPVVVKQTKPTTLSTPKIVLEQPTAQTNAIRPRSNVQNPFGSSARSSSKKSVLSRWSFSLPRGRCSQKSITWYSADEQTSSSQISSTTSPSSLSPVYGTPLSSSETLHGRYKIPEYTFMDELQRRLNQLHLPQELFNDKCTKNGRY